MAVRKTDSSTPSTPSGPAGSTVDDQPRLVNGVDRALYLLTMFATSRRPDIGVTEIAQELGVAKSSVHRVLSALRNRQVLAFDPVSKRYSLGRANMTFGRAYLKRSDIRAVAGAHMPRLSERTGATVGLAIQRGGSWLYVDQVVPASELRVELPLGRPHDLDEPSPVGLAFLAHLHDEVLRPFAGKASTQQPLDVSALAEQVASVRDAGFAVSDEAEPTGAVQVAAPVLDLEGEAVAVLVVTGPRSLLEASRDVVVSRLLATAAAVGEALSRPGRA